MSISNNVCFEPSVMNTNINKQMMPSTNPQLTQDNQTTVLSNSNNANNNMHGHSDVQYSADSQSSLISDDSTILDEHDVHHNPTDPSDSSSMLSYIDGSEREVMSMDQAINKIGKGKFQRRILFAAGTCFMSDATEIMLLSFLTIILQKEWDPVTDDDISQINDNEFASIFSFMFAGALVGTLILGRAGDKYGRKPILCVSAFIICVFGFATAFCNNITSLLVVRTIVGFGIGGLIIPFDILAEFVTTEERGKYLLLIEYFWVTASMLVPVIAYVTIKIFHSWRLFVLICATPCAISFFVSLCYVPESPRWLVSQGRSEEALNILRDAAIVNGVMYDGDGGLNNLFLADFDLEIENNGDTEVPCSELFKPEWRKRSIALWVLWLTYSFCYYGTVMVITRTFGKEDEADDDNNNSDTLPDFDYNAIFVSSCAELAGTTIVILILDRVGRVKSQVFSLLVGGFSVFYLCIVQDENISSDGGDGSRRFVLITVAFFARMSAMIGTSVMWIATVEVLPTSLRSTGHAVANSFGRIGAFVAPYIVAERSTPIHKVGLSMLIMHLVAAFAAWQLPETTGIGLG